MIAVFIIDDHPMVIEGIKMLVQHSAIVQITGSAADAYDALEKLKQIRVDVALVDINLPDLDGIELCKQLKQRFPEMKILGLSTFKERSYITRMIGAGASGYLLKNASGEELEDAIQTAHKGRLYMSLEITGILTNPHEKPEAPLLTSREKEVLCLIGEGLTNGEIAEKLFISPLTVDSHRKNLLAKFGVKNTAAMVKVGLQLGLL